MASKEIRFSSPPASEVLQGIFFDTPSNFSTVMLGALWAQAFRDDFPITEEKPPIEETQERFGADMLRKGASPRWRISSKPDTPRIWARSEKGNQILQLQTNLLITNWLKEKQSTPYVRFADRYKDFEQRLKSLEDFFQQENLGNVQPTSCLMTYVNHVEVDNLEDIPELTASIFKCGTVPDLQHNAWLPTPDQVSFSVSFPMPDQMGRLHLSANPAMRQRPGEEKQPMLRFDLTAQGQLTDQTIQEALAWLSVGHDWIVNGFVDVTTPKWHKQWGVT